MRANGADERQASSRISGPARRDGLGHLPSAHRTDHLPLTAQGQAEAVRLGERLEGSRFAAVLTSPLQRAVRTCEVAGFGSKAEVEPDLAGMGLRHV